MAKNRIRKIKKSRKKFSSKKSQKPSIFWAITLLALIIFFVLVVLTFGTRTVVYNTTESYIEYIPYTEEMPLKYEIMDPPGWINDNVQMRIKNTDNVSGTYNVSLIFESEDKETIKIFNRSAILSPGQRWLVAVSRLEIEMSGNITISATVIPSEKTVQKTRPELRTREVMKEKEVSLLQYILHLY